MDNFDVERYANAAARRAFEEGLLSHFKDNADCVEMNGKNVKSFLDEPLPLSIIDKKLCYKDSNGNLHALDTSEGVTKGSIWLSSKLVPPSFDIFQNGNIRKALEAQNLFVAINIVKLLNDVNYTNEFENVLKGYDFKTCTNPINGSTFVELVADWLQDNSIIINIIISSSKYIIVREKKDDQDVIIGMLPEKEAIGILELRDALKGVTFEYTKPGGKLSSKEVKKLSKIELLQTISKCEGEKEDIIQQSEYSTLWRILRLNSEYLSISQRKALKVCAYNEVTKAAEGVIDDADEISNLITKCKKRLISAAVTCLKMEQVELYLEDKLGYILPQKT